jgi:8-oxo-dGTP diphosphatase
MLTVVAAIIESKGELLVCQRRRGSNFELMWEFPGGKRKSGETLEAALARELREELEVEGLVGQEVYRTIHKYDELRQPIELVFFAVKVNREGVRNCVFEQMQWRLPPALAQLDFLPADRELVKRLASGELSGAFLDKPGSQK